VQPCSGSSASLAGFLRSLGGLGCPAVDPPPSSSISLPGPPPSPQGKHFHRTPSAWTENDGWVSLAWPGRGQRNLYRSFSERGFSISGKIPLAASNSRVVWGSWGNGPCAWGAALAATPTTGSRRGMYYIGWACFNSEPNPRPEGVTALRTLPSLPPLATMVAGP
jgi:hypothetical protein